MAMHRLVSRRECVAQDRSFVLEAVRRCSLKAVVRFGRAVVERFDASLRRRAKAFLHVAATLRNDKDLC